MGVGGGGGHFYIFSFLLRVSEHSEYICVLPFLVGKIAKLSKLSSSW